MNTFPGEMPLGKGTLLQQAQSVGYQDIFRDIQLQREAAYRKEVKDGEFTSEFSGIGDFSWVDLLTSLAILAGAVYIWKNYVRTSKRAVLLRKRK